tara:strand:- start:4413 stop:5030 length:618 start_codon:yes stop_codon:yes gene_type:complete
MLNFKNIYYDGPLDGGGRIWIDYIKHYDFPKFNSIMEMCSGPGFMGFFLGMKYGVQDIHLVDIHPPCLESIQETNKHNNLDAKFYLSDTFDNYDGPKVDFICANPPHLKSMPENYFEDYDSRILVDKDWYFHKKFFKDIYKYLKVGGHLLLLENKNSFNYDLIYSMCNRLELIKEWEINNGGVYSALFKYHDKEFINKEKESYII